MSELRFKIDAFRPDTIPMARLAEYMAKLAALLGHEESVHFVRLEPGSVQLVHHVLEVDEPKVEERINALVNLMPAPDVLRAYNELEVMLANDNAVGALANGQGTTILKFEGRTKPKPIEYGAFSEQGTFHGVPIRIGGTGEDVAIHLQEHGPSQAIHLCTASRALARRMAEHLFTTAIRVHGTGSVAP